jgi:propionyl-CoA synthetase
MGSIVVKLPLPPGCVPTLWENDDGFRGTQSRKWAEHGARPIRRFAWRKFWPHIPAVAECAVIGVADALKGEVPCGFVVLKADSGPRSLIR